MAKDVLLEIGLEELPARFVPVAVQQLADKITKWLSEQRIGHESVSSYATPRRLAVLIRGAAEMQEDISEEAKGPSKKIALDDNGAWSKAALGFARGQGVEPNDFYFKEVGGVEYVYVTKHLKGAPTLEAISRDFPALVTSLNFPKNMRWGSEELRYARPIRWLVCLYGSEIVPITVAGITADRTTRGHRFLGKDVSISSPAEYESTLRGQFVIADSGTRRAMITGQIEAIAAKQGWSIPMQEDLLEEVVYLVEYPTALYGTFEKEFLSIPKEVLITSMREHQRYFPVLDGEGRLLPHFVTVRNGDDRSLELVAKGNAKVLRARLSDARFFYEEDQKMPIESALKRLETIVFHEELGTIGDKVRRIVSIADRLAEKLASDAQTKEDVHRAASICKFDLVTQMVYEFPELQGIMGRDYALKAGERDRVAEAVSDHYKPRFSGDTAPSSLVGTIVSMADKIDTLAGCFSIGIIPTGSQDPYGLRRQAAGIVQMILDHKLPIELTELSGIAFAVHAEAGLLNKPQEAVLQSLLDFFGLRMKNVLSELARYDVVDAVMEGGINDVCAAVARTEALADKMKEITDWKETVESFNRVSNLAAKADGTPASVDTSLFEADAEAALFAAWQTFHRNYVTLLEARREREALDAAGELKDAVTRFFDSVMVMADNEAVRANRLALLYGISADLKRFADFRKLVI